jgi:hypothetical protein
MDPVSYAKHDDPNYNSKTAKGCEDAGEPCFTLRAQDVHAALTVRFWAVQKNIPEAMAENALNIAEAMDLWPVKKEPDL